MSRRHRVQYSNALYHVTSRGVRREDLYLDDDDRHGFLERIGSAVQKFGWRIFAFALMSNHFHLYFRTPEPNLCRGMQWLLVGHAKAFNRRHQFSGHVFEARYRCGVVEDESYGWTVSRYVHLNPVPNLVAHPQQWRWSSYRGYCDPRHRIPWVQYDELLNAWQGKWGGEAIRGYRQFVESALEAPRLSPFESATDGWILGGSKFVTQIRQLISPNSHEPSARQARLVMPVTLTQIVSAACDLCDTSPEELKISGSCNIARPIVAYLAYQHSSATLRESAEVLGLSRPDSVPALLKKIEHARPDSYLIRVLELVRQRLAIE